MFDTIRMKTNVVIYPIVLPQDRTKIIDRLIRETGELKSTYRIRDNEIHYICYSEASQLLVIEVSIPKFLFGHNVRMINESDIADFWTKLHERLYGLFQVEIDQASWIVERLDVCLNFNVGSQVGEYVTQIAKKRMPYCKSNLIGYNQTVEFKTGKNRRVVTFYDKEQDCIDKKQPQEVIEQAKGILRFEITASKYELRAYTESRKAIDLLTSYFFSHMINKPKVQKLLEFPETITPTWDLKALKELGNSIHQIETMIGFKALLDTNGEAGLKPLYNPQTFASRKRLAQTLNFPSAKRLADLT